MLYPDDTVSIMHIHDPLVILTMIIYNVDHCCLTSSHPQIEKRLEPVEEDEGNGSDEHRSKSGCTIFLGYTSNLISSGVRESIRYLVEHKMVHMCIHFP